nr:ribonuclease H-like domain-containing protein [Tanacetum cinerariifolium]
MDESIFVSSVIDSWKDFKHTLKAGKDDLSLVQLGSQLRIKESLKAQDNDNGKGKEVGGPSINMTEEGGKNKHHKQNKGKKRSNENNSGSSSNKKPKLECWKCSKTGHFKRVAEVVDAIAWWIDSRATTYVCKDHCWFKTYEPVEDESILYVGDDHFALVHGKGSFKCEIKSFQCDNGDEFDNHDFHKLFHDNGHAANHFGYRCLDLNTNKNIISLHVTFDETVFSFASTKSTTTHSYDFLDDSTDLISTIIRTAPITPVPAPVHTPQVDVSTSRTPPTPPPPPTPHRYKARLVANGSTHVEGVDVDETFSPVVKPGTIRTVLSLAISQQWPVHQLDVKNAFLHDDLAETVYMHQPSSFRDPEHLNYVCLLQRPLYGLKQTPRAWFQRFAAYITTVGFTPHRAHRA